MATSAIDIFLVYNMIRRLTTPFEKWDAYKEGVIDADGKIIVDPKNRTPEQKKSLQLFDVLILNMKKILSTIPGGRSRIATYSAALFLLKEENQKENLITEENVVSYIVEDAPVNAISTGNIASTDRFLGAKVFQVTSGSIHKSRFGKEKHKRFSKYLDEDDDNLMRIKAYAKRYPKEKIILQNNKTGEMVFFRR